MSSPSWRGVVDYSTNTGAFVFGQPRVWADTRMLNLGSPPVSVVDLSPDGRRLAVILYADGSDERNTPQAGAASNSTLTARREQESGLRLLPVAILQA